MTTMITNYPSTRSSVFSVIPRFFSRMGWAIINMAAAVTPHPEKIEVKMSDGSKLTKIPARVWERHSALITATYESERARVK